MDFLDLSLPDAKTVIINFPGRPITHEIEPHSHVWFHDKYRTVGNQLNQWWVGFIGCQQKYHNHEIQPHTEQCLQTLADRIRDKMVIIMASSAGAGGVLASPIARRTATGMILLNANPFNVWREIVEADLADVLWWIDFYNGFEDYAWHAKWAEEIAKEEHRWERNHERIEGQHMLTAQQVLHGVRTSLCRRNIIE